MIVPLVVSKKQTFCYHTLSSLWAHGTTVIFLKYNEVPCAHRRDTAQEKLPFQPNGLTNFKKCLQTGAQGSPERSVSA